ncbi:MAG: SUMF1/EgtB/PvdO family nonheme iron enzyme [Proteobacteria bacterium]|uniref:SUMF1/EgtB/PvdO family nonheme iron enzyme n=1 Tax=Candidatus Avisuccinivibrio stercorigallinarum TaxID=2840704 RepID=A0A9D9DEE8_9GAMM|nr:SUMF1/EgtB/PvdO family nonheme iron enzyme [Candidatus Avisuccinivibrio stercorigallinarum]
MLRKLLLLSALLAAIAAQAAVDEKYYNPVPMDDDVIVSMPCDLKMVFRKVYTSTDAERLKDTKFSAGSAESDNSISQSPNYRYIQGGFHDEHGYYYLMGKYEVSALQYQALISDKCPKVSAKLRYPAASISWFDAQEAARQYSLFLAKNADTPKEGTALAFARLPTDSEFEYAVRGGLEVGQAQFNASTFVKEGSLRDYAWFSGSQSSNGKVNLPGKLKPNPLGLFDMLGNVQEMTSDPYYATRAGRLHGQSGGFIARGGSFLTPAADMTSALRAEKPYYINGVESKAKDLGMRLVLSVPVLTDMAEVKKLNAENEKLGADDDSTDAATLAKLDAIIKQNKEMTEQSKQAQAEKSSLEEKNAELTAALSGLHTDMVKAQAERDEMRQRAVENNLRVGGMLCLNVANARIMRMSTEGMVSGLKKLSKGKEDPRLAALEKRAADEQASEDFFTTFFADQIAETRGLYQVPELQAQLDKAVQSVNKIQHNNIGDFIKVYFAELKAYKEGSDLQQNMQRLNDKCFAVTKGEK